MLPENTEQQALDTMRTETIGPLTEGDQQAHEQLQAEINPTPQVEAVAKEAGPALTKRFVEIDGIIVPEAEYKAALQSGQDISIHTTAGRRS